MRMLCLIQIIEDRSRSDNPQFQMFHPEAFQVLRLEMFQQAVVGSIGGKYPVLHLESEETGTEHFLEFLTVVTLDKNLFRREIIKQFVDIIDRSLGCQELTGRNIQKSDAANIFSEMNGSKEVVFLMVQNIVIDRNSRRNQLRNPSFHQFLGHLRVFQLIADCNTFTGTDQFRQIGIERMMRETRHFDKLSRSVGFFSLYDSQYFGTDHGIFAIHFVKVSYTE